MRIPGFKNEREEADWLYAHRKEIEKEFFESKKVKSLTVRQIIERERTKPISIRLAIGDIERAKEQAKAKGIGYQTLIRMLVHDSLRQDKFQAGIERAKEIGARKYERKNKARHV